MNTDTVINNFRQWLQGQTRTTRLQRHEAMKAMLFAQGITDNKHPTMEYKIMQYHGDRDGLIDYLDDDTAIEIDDGHNIKSFNKLVYARENMGRRVLWILILDSGRGGKSRRSAQKFGIDMLRVFARNNDFHFDFISGE